MAQLTRRDFVKTSTAFAGAAFTISGTKSSGNVLGANDRIRVAVAGIHGRGQSHISGYNGIDDVEIAYLVDPDSRLFDKRIAAQEKAGKKRPTAVQDIREALDDKDLDAISVATPNHWHSLMGIWACQAGKDAYIEKPISHNVFEGRVLANAAKKYKRIVQHGTQTRSNQGTANLIAAIQAGKYGKLLVSKGYCCKPRWSIDFKKIEKPPAGLDFNTWLGPAPEQPYHGNLVHYNWHWFWDTGNGDTGNQGVHQMDVALWAIKGATMPNRVWSLGGRFGYQDQGQTPNTQLAVYEYGETLLVFETRGLVGKHEGFDRKVANEFFTTDGVIRGNKFQPYQGGKTYEVEVEETKVTPGGPFGSFIAAVRSRKPDDVNCDAEVGHYSSALCHLANVSHQLGENVPFNKKTKRIGDNATVADAFEKIKANCKAVGVNLAETEYRLGRELKMNPETERFIDDKEANELLTRNYRKPYVVPEVA